MINTGRLEEKYLNDPTFHMVVDSMYNLIEKCQLTPDEIREAAMFAAIRYSYLHPMTIIIPRDEYLEFLKIKHE